MSDYACAILVDDARLHLGRRLAQRRAHAGCWDTIGGKVEPGETVVEALARELGEDLGIVPTASHALASLDGADARGQGSAVRDDENGDLCWFTVGEARALRDLALADYPAPFRRLGLGT